MDAGAKATGRESSRGATRERRGGALDPRLLRYARTTRRFVVLAVAVGGATALLVVAQAFLIATVVAGAFVEHRSVTSLRTPIAVLLAVIAGRAALAWAAERAAHRASASAKSELRRAASARIATLGPSGLERRDTGQLSVLMTTGVDALDGYFSRYLPQLFLAVIVPVTIIGVVAGADWVSAALIAVSLPLIPLFMALVGATTKDRTAARMRSLQKLAGHFLDVVAGLPTLKVFGRAKAQARSIAAVTDRYRSATMATLRLTFLSSLILELLATVSVALVAVAVGLRLLGGHMSFEDALFVLVLAPEAYLPLRALGANYHASADGMKAAEEIFELLEEPEAGPAGGTTRPSGTAIRITGLDVTYPGRRLPALHDATLAVEPGETVALTGASGCGKSTLLSVILGLRLPDAGTVTLGGVDLADARPGRLARATSAGSPNDRTSSRARSPTTSASGGPMPPTPRWRRHSTRPGSPMSCGVFPWAPTRPSARVAPASRPESGSASRWRGPSCETRPSSCWTSRPPAWTTRPRPTCSRRSARWSAAGRH